MDAQTCFQIEMNRVAGSSNLHHLQTCPQSPRVRSPVVEGLYSSVLHPAKESKSVKRRKKTADNTEALEMTENSPHSVSTRKKIHIHRLATSRTSKPKIPPSRSFQ